MTSHPGYRRLSASPDTLQADMWAWMRRKRTPWTCLDLAAATGASERQARRYVRRLASAGYLDESGSTGGEAGRISGRLWRLARDTGPLAPTLIGGAAGDEVGDLNSDMTGAQLARIRHDLGMSLSEFAAGVLAIRDRRTARRYEIAAVVPHPAAERVRAFLSVHSSGS